MSYTEKHLDQVDSYLSRPGRNGDGPPHLSKEGQTDPPLKEAMTDVQMVWQATRLEKLHEKLEMLREFEAELEAKAATFAELRRPKEAEESEKGKLVRMTSMRWVLSAAAGVLLLIAVGWFLFRGQGPQEIQHEYLAMHFDEYLLHDVTRGDNASAQYTPEQLQAYALFEFKNLDRAMPLLEGQWIDKQDTLALFYLITAQVAKGDVVSGRQLYDENRDALSDRQRALLEKLF